MRAPSGFGSFWAMYWFQVALCVAALAWMIWIVRARGNNLTASDVTRKDARLLTRGG